MASKVQVAMKEAREKEAINAMLEKLESIADEIASLNRKLDEIIAKLSPAPAAKSKVKPD